MKETQIISEPFFCVGCLLHMGVNVLFFLLKKKNMFLKVIFNHPSAGNFDRHEAELAAAVSQPLPDDDDDVFD